MSYVAKGAIGLLGLLGGLAAITWLALESGQVAVLETRTEGGSTRTTHVWYVHEGGELWVEAGSPENGWYVDIRRTPRLHFESEEIIGDFVALPSLDRAVHSELRSKLAARYGWRDAWVSWGVDSSRSLAVRLLPLERQGEPGKREPVGRGSTDLTPSRGPSGPRTIPAAGD